SGVKRAKSVSLFHDNDQESLYVLMHLDKYIREKDIQSTVEKVIVQVENERYQSELISFLKKVEHFSFPVEIMNVYEEIAKRFWQSHEAVLEKDSRLNFLLVSYEWLGKQIVDRALHVASSDKLNFTVLDQFEKEEKCG